MIVPILLLSTGLVLRFAFRAYDLLGDTLIALSVFYVLYRTVPRGLQALLLIGAGILALVVFLLEIQILRGSRSDLQPGSRIFIVLGAAVIGNEMSPAMQRRVEAVLPYLLADPSSIAVLSGAYSPSGTQTEAEMMFRYFLSQGITPDRLYKEEASISTLSNLRNSFQLLRSLHLDPLDAVIVTSPYHLYRARTTASFLGVSCRGLAGRHGRPLSTINSYYREAFALLKLYSQWKRK